MIHRLITLALLATIPLLCTADELGDDLLAAARKGDLAGVKALLDKGADVNSKSPYGSTALFFAADRGKTDIVKLLLDRGANANVKDTFYGATALSWALDKGNLEIVKMLLAKGADGVNELLGSALESGNKELIQAALDTGKVTQRTLNYGLSAVTKAKKEDLAEMLKKAGAKPLEPANAQVPAETLRTYTGRYQGGRGGTGAEMIVALKDGKLSLSNPSGDNPLTLAAISATCFRGVEQDQVEIEFKSQDGNVSGMDFIEGGGTMSFTRVVAK